MTPPQRAGQLLMVGLQPTGSSRALAAQVKAQRLGGVIYLGGWSGGTASMATISKRLQGARPRTGCWSPPTRRVARSSSCAGPGFTRMPSARTQAHSGVARRGGERRDLVPRARGRPASTSTSPRSPTPCPPRWARPTSRSAATAATSPPARPTTNATVCRGLRPRDPRRRHRAHRQALPGPGPRSPATPTSRSTGITDRTDRRRRPLPRSRSRPGSRPARRSSWSPRRATPSSTRTTRRCSPRPSSPACCASRLGFDGVVITDDVGAAKAVRRRPGRRSGRRGSSPPAATSSSPPRRRRPRPCSQAIAAKRAASPAFAAQVDAAAARVLDLKADLGLVKCG